MDMVDLDIAVKKVIDAAMKAGRFIEGERENFDFGKIEYKGKNDLVSYVDKQAEAMLMDSLHRIVPEAGFIAEEGSGIKNESGMNWLIDPLDGTTNFMHGFPSYSVSIGLMDKTEVILGVIYDISKENCYWAVKNGKAYCDGKEIRVSVVKNFEDGLYITGYPYRDFSKYRNFYDLMYYFLTNTHGVRRVGSAAIDLAYVASGKSEGFFEFSLSPWDVAAGSLIVKQAGGLVSDFKGGNNYLFGKEFISGNLYVHNKMQQTIQEFWDKQY
jgi:myo-inositol-1(or 4)-monophosphatase